MKRTDFDGERVRLVQEKTGSHLWLKCPKPLRAALEKAHYVSEYLLNSIWKRPYADSTTLGHAIERHLKKLGIDGYTMHGLRKNAAVELAEAGATVEELVAVLGHKTPKMALYYCKLASQRTTPRSKCGRGDRAQGEGEGWPTPGADRGGGVGTCKSAKKKNGSRS